MSDKSEQRYKYSVLEVASYLFGLATGANGGNGDAADVTEKINWLRWRIRHGWSPTRASDHATRAVEIAVNNFAFAVLMRVEQEAWMVSLAGGQTYGQWLKEIMLAGQEGAS